MLKRSQSLCGTEGPPKGRGTDLDDDQFLLFGFLVGPVLTEAEVNLKGGRVRSFAPLEQDQAWVQKQV